MNYRIFTQRKVQSRVIMLLRSGKTTFDSYCPMRKNFRIGLSRCKKSGRYVDPVYCQNRLSFWINLSKKDEMKQKKRSNN